MEQRFLKSQMRGHEQSQVIKLNRKNIAFNIIFTIIITGATTVTAKNIKMVAEVASFLNWSGRNVWTYV